MMTTARQLAEKIHGEGGVTFFVGGTVRDALLGKTPKDIDCEVFGLSQDKLEAILATFGDVNFVGKAFGIYKVGDIDVALPRTETKTGDGHKGFTVEPNPFLNVKDAMRRRDFTMNAVYQNVLTGEISDFFGGILDIENKILCVVDEGTFVEDSLRVLRAGQFASRLGFKVAGRSLDLMRSMDLSDLPAERVMGEIEKLLLGDFVKHGLQVLDSVGAIEKLFPELDILRTIPQDEFWHPEGDVWTHTLMVMDRANEYCN